MNSAAAPHLVDGSRSDEDVLLNNDPKLRAPLSKFRFRPSGSLVYHGDPPRPWTKAQVTASGQQRAHTLKIRAARAGRASADDAMYWSLQVLRMQPDIAAAVAGRFDELLVDEAQDTSELQLACLHALSATGRLRSLALIGDADQSIYSFQGASPDGIATLSTTRGLQVLTLDENHRSSQTLCNMTARLRPRPHPDRAVGPHATCEWAPELTTYDPAQPHQAVARYQQRMHTLGVADDDAVVLARRKEVVALLNGEPSKTICDERPRTLGHAVAAHRTATLGRSHLDRIDKIIAYAAWDAPLSTLDQEQRRMIRNASMKLLTAAPALDLDLRSWIRNAAATLKTVLADVVDTSHHQVGNIFRSATGQEAVNAEAIFITTAAAAYTSSNHPQPEGRNVRRRPAHRRSTTPAAPTQRASPVGITTRRQPHRRYRCRGTTHPLRRADPRTPLLRHRPSEPHSGRHPAGLLRRRVRNHARPRSSYLIRTTPEHQ